MATTIQRLIDQVRSRLREDAVLAPPGPPTITNVGAPGATDANYKVTATNSTGETQLSAVGNTGTSNATLNGTNYNVITWSRVAGAAGYKVYKLDSGSYKLLATISSGATVTSSDQGAAVGAVSADTNTTGLRGSFWNDNELIDIINHGVKDLWRAIVDLGQDHFLTVDATNVSMAASATTLSGVPADLYKIVQMEVRDLTSTSLTGLLFRPKDYNDPAFFLARSRSAQDPKELTIWYSQSSAGGPVAAPTIYVSPMVNAAVLIRLAYVPVLSALGVTDNNPIPGESDNALISWTIAFARAKEREEASPDPEHLAIYATEKQNILTSLTPRQTQEPEFVDALFETYWE